jgi:hypothetical protein
MKPDGLRRAARYEKILRAACVLALVAIALMVWSVLDPRPAPVVIAMSIGQVFGTLALAAFVYVILSDLRRAKLIPDLRDEDEKRASTPPSE